MLTADSVGRLEVDVKFVLELLGEKSLGHALDAGESVAADGEGHRKHDERLTNDVEELQ